MQLDELRLDLLREAATDVVGLWSVLSTVKALHPSTPENQKAETLAAIRDLLAAGYVEVGQYSPLGGWTWWDMPADEIVSKIEREWNALGQEPSLGDIAWLRSTQSGNRFVEDHPKIKGS